MTNGASLLISRTESRLQPMSVYLMSFKFFAIHFNNHLEKSDHQRSPRFSQASPNSLLSPLFSREKKPISCSPTAGGQLLQLPIPIIPCIFILEAPIHILTSVPSDFPRG